MFDYFEERNHARSFKEAYVQDIRKLISDAFSHKEEVRTHYISGIAKDSEAYRRAFRDMLGWPLNCPQIMAVKPSLTRELLQETSTQSLYRVTITVLGCIRFTGLLFLHRDEMQHPFLISQHGGLGSPEICSGLFRDGTGNYNDMTQRIFRQGANVFAPQLLLWSNDYETNGFRRENRNEIDAQLKQLGGSITALEIACLIKSLDAFCEAGIAQEEHLGMIGLSYGGFYTLFTAAAEPRIKAALSCSFFNQRSRYSWIDWTWTGSALRFFDAEAALLVYPRYLCIAVGDKDELFDVTCAKQELQRLSELSEDIYGGSDWYDTCIFSGVHEFLQADEYIQKVVEIVRN